MMQKLIHQQQQHFCIYGTFTYQMNFVLEKERKSVQVNVQEKYSWIKGGSKLKNSEVCFPKMHVKAFLIKEHTMYIFPTMLRPMFKLFLKSRNLNELVMSPNIHSTDVLTVLMDLLFAIISGVSTAPLKGDCKCTLNGYAASPYKHNGTPVGEKAYCPSWSNRFESASIPESCLFPSIKV